MYVTLKTNECMSEQREWKSSRLYFDTSIKATSSHNEKTAQQQMKFCHPKYNKYFQGNIFKNMIYSAQIMGNGHTFIFCK